MKKSLSLLLAFAMVFSMFSSLAFAADADLTAQQKFDALKDKGIFAGFTDGTAGLDKEMTRAQFARVAGLLAGLDVDAAVDASTFTDVAANHWAVEEIEAAVKANLLEGKGEGKFDPQGNITVQQLAVVVAKILKLEPVADATVEGAADWAAGYIQALTDAGIALPTNYTENATRSVLVEASYTVAGKTGVIAPEKVSVVSAKATGIKEVTVTLDKAVDTEKATLTLKRNSSTVATKATWSDDKRTATLALESAKIMEGDYTVTLAGIDAANIANAEASFKAENEKVVKLEFVAPSDTIAQANKVRVQFQALNQYGEDVSLAAGSFSAYSTTPGGANVQKDANGNLYVVIDTDDSDATPQTMIPNVSQISINVVNTDSQISINKIFKLGSKPYVAKVELGDVTYSNGEDYLSKSGDKAVIELVQYDQYGHRITMESGTLFNATANVVPYLAEIGTPALVDDNNDQILDVVVNLGGDAKVSGEYTVSVFGGSTASKVINIKATQYAATVELDTSVILAEGDSGKYVTVTAYDKEGNKLSAQDIVDNYTSGHIQITTSGNLQLETGVNALLATQTGTGQKAIVKAGEHKGKLYIKNVTTKGIANVFINITPTSANGIMFNKNIQLNVQEKRYPVSLKVDSENAKKAIPAGGSAESKLKLLAIDQYGEKIKGSIGQIQENTRTVTYDVYVEEVTNVAGVTLAGISGTVLGSHMDLSDVLDKDLTFTAAANQTSGEYTVKISLRKRGWDSTNSVATNVIDDSVATVTRGMKIIPTSTKLTYSVKNIDTLFAAIDDPAMKDNVANDGYYDSPDTSKHARTVEIEAKDGSGDKVALPTDYVVGVAPSDSKIVATNSVRKIIGNKAGTTQIAITHKLVEGGSNTVYKEVVVKSDTVSVDSFSGGKAERNDMAASVMNGKNAAEVMDLEVKDNYGTKYKNPEILNYDKLLGVRYSITDIQDGIVVSVDHTGLMSVSGTGSFTLTASSPNGKTRVTAVVVTTP